MLGIDDLRFKELVEQGIPLEILEARLRPFTDSRDQVKELRRRDSFKDFSVGGFLGAGESLLEVVYSDWLAVEQYGIRHNEIAEALDRAIKSRKIPNRNYKLRFAMLACGGQTCPWGCQGQYTRASTTFILYDKKCRNYIPASQDFLDAYVRMETPNALRESSENWRFLYNNFAVVTEIHPHLIGEHYFFEGRESPYRAEPRVLIEALGLMKRNFEGSR